MSEIKKVDNNPFALLKSVPFERPKLVGKNSNFFTILLNQFFTVCRFLINFYASKELASTLIVSYHIAMDLSSEPFSLQFFQALSLLFGFIANILLLLDATGVTTEETPYEGYVSRMTFARFASFWGINSHCLRLGFLTVSFYSSHYSLAPLTGVSKIGMDQAFVCHLVDGIPLAIIGVYLIGLGFHYGGRAVKSRDEVSNPWIEDWESRKEFAKGKKISHISTFLIIGNITILIFFITFFANYKLIQNEQHFELTELTNAILPLVSCLLILIDLTYRVLIKKEYHSNHFILNGFFMSYYLIEMFIELKSGTFPSQIQADILMRHKIVVYTLIAIFCLSALNSILFHYLQIMNLILWVIKWSCTLGGLAFIIQALGVTAVILSGSLAINAFMQNYFYLNIHISKILRVLIQLLVGIYTLLMGAIDAIESVIAVLNMLTLGFFCIIILIMSIILTILVNVGFGSATGPMEAQKVFKVIQSVLKVIAAIRSFKPFLSNIAKFTSKGKIMSSMASNSGYTKVQNGGFIYILFQASGMGVFFISALANYYYSAERNTEYPIQFLMSYLLTFLLCLGAALGFTYLIEFMLARTFDLLILVVDIRIAWGFVWFKISLIVMGVGIALVLVSYLIGNRFSITKTYDFKPSQSIERFVCPSLESSLCPLCSIPKNASSDTNICLVVCNRVACCLTNKEIDTLDEGNTSIRFIRELFCPFIAKEDLQPDLDQPIIANLCFNFCCCCLYDPQKLRRCHPIRCCFCLQNYMRMQDVTEELERTQVSITASEIPHEKWTFQEARSLETSATFEEEISQVERKKVSASEKSGITNRIELLHNFKRVFSNGFNRFPSYLTPLILGVFILYFAYRALVEPWDTMSFLLDSNTESIMSDTSTKSNSGHNDQADISRKATCPILDLLVFLKDLLVKVVFSAMKGFFPQYRELLDKLEKMVILLSSFESGVFFQPFIRFLILLPAIINIAIMFVSSVLSSFFKPLNRIRIVLLLLPTFILYQVLLALPTTLISLFEDIPFLNIKITLLDGFSYARMVLLLLNMCYVLILLDGVFPPVVPKRDLAVMKTYVKHYDDELNDAFMN